ncbi:MAG: tyrosine-type recombinase/integrase [Deltaproteobacteria bacterium]|nr:tyrosine-type recombinase/integrase [Deltaproteobacteria bacterium]
MRLFRHWKTGVWYVEMKRNRRRSLNTTDETEAQLLYKEILRAETLGRLINIDAQLESTPLSEFMKVYEQNRTIGSVGGEGLSTRTIRQDMLALRLLKDATNDIAIKSIDVEQIRLFERLCLARKVKPVSVNSYLRHIKTALNYAKREGYITELPRITMIPIREKAIRLLTMEQIKKILDKAKEHDETVWKYFNFLIWTGARRREALMLEGKDFFTIGTKRKKQLQCTIRETKTKKPRTIPIPDELRVIIEPLPEGRIFNRLKPDDMTKIFKKITRDCGIEARLHDLRHSAATYMLASGIPIQVVAALLGHAQLSTTMIYAHIADDVKSKEMKKYRLF